MSSQIFTMLTSSLAPGAAAAMDGFAAFDVLLVPSDATIGGSEVGQLLPALSAETAVELLQRS